MVADARQAARVELTRASVGGGLYVEGELAEQAVRASQMLSRPNPAYRRWVAHVRRRGRSTRPAPPQRFEIGGPLPKGGRWLPRYAPVLVHELEDRTVFPPAERLELGVRLRPYQVDARDALLWEQSGVVVAPCGAGKTTIGASVIAELATPALVLVHTLDLATQWLERIEQQLDARGGLVGDGRCDDEARVTVATIQTLVRWPWDELVDWGRRFGVVILDEAHHAPARTFAEVLAALPGRYRLGLTATPRRQDGLTDLLFWSCGPLIYRVEQQHLEAIGSTLRPAIHWIDTGWAPSTEGERDWTKLVGELVSDATRNRLVVELVRERVEAGRVVLVLSDRVAHAVELAEQLTASGTPAEALVGRVPKRTREQVLERARAGELRALTATSVADEGLDVPVLDCVVLTCPSRNLARVQQRVGRALRTAPGKSDAEVFDLVDDFGAARNMAWQRFRLYRSLGWDPERPVVR